MSTVFLIGIGGMGMMPLALYLHKCGFTVSGWDDQTLSDTTKEWFSGKITLTPTLPSNCETVVYSSAIHENHPLRQEAKKRNIPVVQRGIYLAQILKDKQIVGIVGSHGKTTTTAWIIHFLKTLNFPFDYLLGGCFQKDYLPAEHHPVSQWVVVEIDESDGTLLNFHPDYLVILNDDWDHSAFYPTSQDYAHALQQLSKQTKQKLFLSKDLNWGSIFQSKTNISYFGASQPNIPIPVLSKSNILGAISVVTELTGKHPSDEAFFTFPGIKRRQECLFKNKYLSVTTDYAHHPTEVEAYLRFARLNLPDHKHWVVFEPHRYSRTQIFAEDFAKVLNSGAEKVFLLPIYGASELNTTGISSEQIARRLNNFETLDFLKISNFCDHFEGETTPIATHFLGAGVIDKWSRTWLTELKEVWQSILLEKVKSLKKHVSLKSASMLKIGGDALFFAKPENTEELSTLLATLKTLKLPWFVIGNGSNLLIPETTFDGVIIQLKSACWQEIRYISNTTFEVRCGRTIKSLLDDLQKNGVGGFEFLEGIPATLGGALKMNASTGSESLFDRLLSLTLVHENGICETLTRDKIQFSYRKCSTLDNAIAIKATFQGEKSNEADIRSKRDIKRKKRLETQPLGLSLGCFFKNTPDAPAGKLLDELELKGKRFGGAYISEKHANFILNDGSASFQDVIQLVSFVHRYVKQKTGISLELEIEILNFALDLSRTG